LQVTKHLVSAPVFGQLYGGAPDIAMILLQLGLEAAKKGKRIGGRAGKARENLVLIKPTNFLRRMLDYTFAQRDLAVSGHDHCAIPADT